MATTSTSPLPTAFNHPLDPLTPEEIAAVSLAVRQHVASTLPGVKAIKFITNYLLPPPKKAVLAHLGIPLTPGGTPESPVTIVRKAEVDFLDCVNGHSYNVILAFENHKWEILTFEKLPEGVQPQISVEELVACEAIVKADPRVQQLAKDVGILPEQIYCDGALVFARFSEHENLYAHPMDFVPVIDANADKVIHIDFPPHYKASTNGAPNLIERVFPLQGKHLTSLPDLLSQNDANFKARDDIKPLHIVQPEGVSFKMNGNELEWQNWKMHIAFSHREGIALSTITYNDHGEVRPVIYRLSLAEMVVPYGAPEFPHPRKFAFDSGEYGMGTMANELSLGCDCLGQIHYLPGAYVAHDGNAVVIKNVICIHEEDSGVLWKHTDYRPGGRSQTVRRRRLVVSMVCTLANYEYIWNYMFYQDGNIELEVRLTGILQAYVSADGEPNKFGSIVAPNVNAHYHQHLFCTGSAMNFAGNAFISQDTVLTKEAGRPYDFAKERRWRITNPARKHYCSGKDVGYGIQMKGGITPMMARNDGWALKRASFTHYPVWVCKDVEGEKGSRMWPAGKYVPQTRESPEDSVGAWVKGEQNVENEDLLVYLTVGVTHIPRPEDWPDAVEHLSVIFRPISFFDKNPSMDVPGVQDPHSVAAFSQGQNGSVNTGSHGCH
ncbi:peroxisomal copper amine oxidase [Hymenopellis radicata]|nr:peroxisomal copper amine oxidase [Hymenopellis radicata]